MTRSSRRLPASESHRPQNARQLFSARGSVPEGPTLKVMTYNVMGVAGEYQAVTDTIQEEDADVVFIQELTPELADWISNRFIEIYPYQLLDPRDGANGIGTMSRFPLISSEIIVDGKWNGIPQVLFLEWNDQNIMVINYHMHGSSPKNMKYLDQIFNNREQNASVLVDIIRQAAVDGPVILAGDANTTHLNAAYKIINGELLDGRLDQAPDDGSFGEFRTEIDPDLLLPGTNLLEIRTSSCRGDLDDFEFVNVQIELTP